MAVPKACGAKANCGAARFSDNIARDGELPAIREKRIWNRPAEGLLVTTGAALLVANLLDLSSLSTMGSAGFLVVYAAVDAANARMANRTGSRAWISWSGCAASLAALAALVWHAATRSPSDLLVLVAMLGLALAVEGVYRLATGRRLRLAPPGPADG